MPYKTRLRRCKPQMIQNFHVFSVWHSLRKYTFIMSIFIKNEMALQPFVTTSNTTFHQNSSSHFLHETFRWTDIIFHTCVQFMPVVQKTHNKESRLESECILQNSLIRTSLTLRPNIEFMPFTLSLLIRRRCSSYSRNGKPSEISLAFSSPLQSRFGLQT